MPTMVGPSGSAWPQWDRWHVTPLIIILGLVTVLFLALVVRPRSPRSYRAWGGALVVTMVVLSSDIQSTAMTSYRSHMIEHLAVILVIAPLVAAGCPWRLSRSAATTGLLAFTMLIPLYHVTSIGSWVMEHSGGHDLELLSFTIVGTWYWIPIYGSRRALTDAQRLTFTFVALPVMATTGLVLWSADSSSMNSVGMNMPMMGVNDIRAGGVVMIAWGSAAMSLHLLGIAAATWGRRVRSRPPIGVRYLEV